MVRFRAAVAGAMLSAALGCNGSQGAQGPAGPQGPPGAQGPPGTPGAAASTGDGGLLCAPKSFFCDGNNVGICSTTGNDAFDFQACDQTSATNKQKCVTTGCSRNQGAGGTCCQYTKPIVAWDLTSPLTDMQSYTGIEENLSGNGPTACLQDPMFTAAAGRTESVCPAKSYHLSISFPRATFTVGTALTLTTNNQQGANIYYNNDDGTSCYQWTGTVKLDSDVPDWMVEVNLKCASQQTNAFSGTLAGTLSGTTP